MSDVRPATLGDAVSAAPRITGINALNAPEVRVLGCLLEKQRTTPDAYPLSLNALRLACNQSTNREPVVDYDEHVVRDALARLERRGLVRLASGAGSRAAKYRHLLAQALPMDDAAQALLCVLMLRGAQTPGELKQRTERMHGFADLAAVHAALDVLIERGLAERLERRPGQKEERYRQLLERDEDDTAAGPAAETGAPAAQAEVAARDAAAAHNGPPASDHTGAPPDALEADLVRRVERLEREVLELRAAMRDPVAQEQR
jgi:hypothetical protein